MGEQLQAHWEATAASYRIQLAATKNAEQLAIALENLTFTTQAELQQINNTTLSIKENLSAPQGQAARLWYSILINAFRIIGRGLSHRGRSLWCLIRWVVGDLPGYHQVSESLIFRILTTVAHLAWSTTWFLLSAMMVMISSELGYLLTIQFQSASLLPLRHLFFNQRESTGNAKPTPPCEAGNVPYAIRYETSRSSLHPLSPPDDRSHPHLYHGKPRHRLRMSLIPERLVHMPVDSV